MTDIEERFNNLVPANSIVPRNVLWRFLEGRIHPETGRDDPKFSYSPDEQDLLLRLAERSKAQIAALPSFSQPLWISSAGGPGAGKSTALLQFAAAQWGIEGAVPAHAWTAPNLYDAITIICGRVPAVWASADRRGLIDLSIELNRFGNSNEDFYKKWRWGTNFLSGVDVALGVAGRKNILHDTTLSGHSNLPTVKATEYYSAVVATASPRILRSAAADARNAMFYQSFAANVTAQDRAFGDKIPDIAGQADEVFFAWRDANDRKAEIAALVKGEKIVIYDETNFDRFRALYPLMDRALLPRLTRDNKIESEIPAIIRRQGVGWGFRGPRPHPWPI